ncbi:MAG TPA: hypothetical protein VKS22_00950 [Candidatus Binataceae bacterium]|nr:hypothetical protein [Candidatus Binataceae bacterium]
MKIRNSIGLLALAGVCTTATPLFAASFDVCATAATDAKFDSTGTFFTATAPVYAGGTIAQSSTAIDCSTITTPVIGTFFTVGAFIAGLPASGPLDTALVTWHFRIGGRAFDTIGPVQGNGAGGATPGQQYPQTIVGSTGGGTGNGQAIVTVLDPSGFVFEITTPRSSVR